MRGNARLSIARTLRLLKVGVCGILLLLWAPAWSSADDLGAMFAEVSDDFCHLCDWASSDLAEREKLLGDIGGLRPTLADSGISIDVTSTQFYQGVVDGGRDREFEYGGRNDYYLNIDGQKAGLWEGLFINLHGESRYGEDVNRSTGAISPVNTGLLFPTPEDETALTGFKITQALSEQFVVFAGKINTLDDYLHPFAAGKGQTQFMNTSFVTPLILLRTIPYSSLGAGFAVLQGTEPIFSLMVIDPVDHPTTSGINDLFAEGASIFGQINAPVTIACRPGHQQLYFSWGNRGVRALDEVSFIITPEGPALLFEEKNSSWSVMYAFDQYLFVDAENPERGWGVFGQLGLSDGNPNPVRWTATGGLGGTAPFRSRPLDRWGVGYYYMQISSDLKDTLAPLTELDNEHGLEVFYNVGITKWFQVTPDLQVVDPAAAARDTAVVAGVRAHLIF